MKSSTIVALAIAAGCIGADAIAQTADTPDAHVAAAKTAAGPDPHRAVQRPVFDRKHLAARGAAARSAGGRAAPAGPPERSTWHAEPVKVFDNLYLRRHDRVLRLGGQDLGRDHPARHDLRLLDRGRSRRRAEEARASTRRRSSTRWSATATSTISAARSTCRSTSAPRS